MKIQINDRFTIENDEYNWILYDTHRYTSKKGKNAGKVQESVKVWYPSSLEFLCEMVINETPKKAGSVTDVLNSIIEAKQDCIEAIKKIPYKHTHI
jgi:hypothetical protein